MANKRTNQELQRALTTLQGGDANAFVAEQVLIHTAKFGTSSEEINVGGMSRLNDANTKVEVGSSDFNGTLLPTDLDGYIRAITIGYKTQEPVQKEGADSATPVDKAQVKYDYDITNVPAGVLSSELVFKYSGVEVLRMPIEQFMLAQTSQVPMSEWAPELMKLIKVNGGKELEMFFNASRGLDDKDVRNGYLKVNIFCIKKGTKKLA